MDAHVLGTGLRSSLGEIKTKSPMEGFKELRKFTMEKAQERD